MHSRHIFGAAPLERVVRGAQAWLPPKTKMAGGEPGHFRIAMCGAA